MAGETIGKPALALNPRGPVAVVRAFTRRAAEEAARCEACGAGLERSHDHVVDRRASGGGVRLLCACAACAVAAPGSDRVRRRARRVGGAPSARVWAALGVPVELALFFRSSLGGAARLLARYPSQAGAIEAHLPEDALEHLAADVPAAAELVEDVEGLLVDRRRDAAYRVSIDVGFELCARMRGATDGGAAARAFFDDLDAEAARG